jgi:peptidoglycan/LPS O-acetylase OafA/YrhL
MVHGVPMISKRATNLLAPNMALSHVLNFSRAIAAVLVLFFHIRSALVVPYEDLHVHNWLARAFFMVTTFGHDAVIIFFVLSGYLVGRAVLGLDMRSPRDISEYWIDRTVRIGPVLIAATALSATLQLMAPASACTDTPATIVGNVIGFQNFLVRPLCNNLPLWSISNELVYYFAFPVIIAASLRLFSIGLAVSFGCVALIFALSMTLTPLDDTNIVLDFPLWLIGAALWFVPNRFVRSRLLSLALLVIALLFGRLDFGKEHFWFRDMLLAAAFSYLLITFFDQAMPASGMDAVLARHAAKWSRYFADLSFSLYVTHYPLIRLYIDITHHDARHTTVTLSLLFEFLCLSTMCILFASGFSALFERPRRLFKRFVIGRLPLSWSPELDGTR